MLVSIHLVASEQDLTPIKTLAIVELEVVPGGTYIVDHMPYQQVGRPKFHIEVHPGATPGSRVVNTSPTTHKLKSVDLFVKLPST